MKKVVLLAGVLVLLVTLVGPVSAEPSKYRWGGFDIDMNVTGPGTGTFSIVGANSQAEVNVSGSFEIVCEDSVWTVTVTFDLGSYIELADGTYIPVGGETFSYSGDAAPKHVIQAVIQWLKSLIESA